MSDWSWSDVPIEAEGTPAAYTWPSPSEALVIKHAPRIAQLMEDKGARRSAAINIMLRKHEITSDEANVLLDSLVNGENADEVNRIPLR